jgi:hypothetical protein
MRFIAAAVGWVILAVAIVAAAWTLLAPAAPDDHCGSLALLTVSTSEVRWSAGHKSER